MSREQIVKDTAYAIWEAEGKPDGRAEEHWRQAEARVAASLTDGKARAADGKAKATHVKELEPSTADVTFFKVGERVYGSQTSEDYAETTLIELTAEGGPKPAIKIPGFASRVVEL